MTILKVIQEHFIILVKFKVGGGMSEATGAGQDWVTKVTTWTLGNINLESGADALSHKSWWLLD